MKPKNLLSAAALIIPLVLLPATASAQRGTGRHHGWHRGGVIAQPVVVVPQPVVVPSVVAPVVVAPPVGVTRPVFGNLIGPFDHSGFGVRVGFGTIPVRTGFETAPVGFGFQHGFVTVPVFVGGHRGFRAKEFRSFGPRHAGRGVVVVRRHR